MVLSFRQRPTLGTWTKKSVALPGMGGLASATEGTTQRHHRSTLYAFSLGTGFARTTVQSWKAKEQYVR